jgi:spore coat protein A
MAKQHEPGGRTTKYRFRILNASNSRFYNLFLSSGQAFTQIGTDGGPLNAPVSLDQMLLGPAERVDVILDFSPFTGQTILVRNDAATPFPGGDTPVPETTAQIMQFRVTKPLSGPDKSAIPANLRPTKPILPLTPTPMAPTRGLLLIETDDQYGRIEPKLGTSTDGALHWNHPITETPNLNDTETWATLNTTDDAHPIHLHLVQFQIVDRQAFDVEAYIPGQPATLKLLGRPIPPDANEAGWKDTARMPPGMVTRIIARFDILGLYVWHCHILEHEDHEMMRPYRVIP